MCDSCSQELTVWNLPPADWLHHPEKTLQQRCASVMVWSINLLREYVCRGCGRTQRASASAGTYFLVKNHFLLEVQGPWSLSSSISSMLLDYWKDFFFKASLSSWIFSEEMYFQSFLLIPQCPLSSKAQLFYSLDHFTHGHDFPTSRPCIITMETQAPGWGGLSWEAPTSIHLSSGSKCPP